MKFALNVLKFEDIREQIIQYLNANSEYAGQFDFRSSNMSYFIDTMAYVLMIMNYNTSHIANNKFLGTTEIRKNGVSRSQEMGYTPKRPYAAKFRGKLIYKGANFGPSNSLTIYPRSPFSGSLGNNYSNIEPIILKYNGNPNQLEGEYTLTEGVFKYYKVPTTGQPNFSFTIKNKNVDEENLSLYVVPLTIADNPVHGLIEPPYQLTNLPLQYKWTMAKTFKEIINTKSYFLEEDIVNEGFPKIVFGNGLITAIPMDTEAIYCEYLEVKGSAANNENLISLPPMDTITDQVFTFYGTENLGVENKSNFNVNNFDLSYQNPYNKSFGGSDLEDLDGIKANAPRYYSSVGRAATKNDYVFLMQSFPGVGSVNVIGGDELYPDDVTKLGNIYASVVPNIEQKSFLYNNNIYLSGALEKDIRDRLNDYAIVGTKRHFYKPSYILVDVAPKIELNKNVSVTEQSKIKTHVKKLINDYFAKTYNRLGVPFRESKVSVNVDNLDYISSSSVDLGFSFVINNNTVENLISGVNNVLYLPTKNLKDGSGNIIGTTNFIKTNEQIVKEDLFPGDWAILSENFGKTTTTDFNDLSDSEKELYRAKLKLLNKYESFMAPQDCSIYSKEGLIHDTASRHIFNRDYTSVRVAEFWYAQNSTNLNSVPLSYQDKQNNKITAKVLKQDDETKVLVFSFKDETNADTDITVARIRDDVFPFKLQLTDDYIDNLSVHFGIDESRFVYEGFDTHKTPFNVVEIAAGRYAVEMRINSHISELIMTGRNNLYDVVVDAGNVLIPTALANTSMWNTLDPISENGSKHVPITMTYDQTTDTVGYIEMSHLGLTNSNNATFFKGFIGKGENQIKYDDVITNIANGLYKTGDYFISTEFIYIENAADHSADTYYEPNDILFINDEPKLVRSDIKRTISTTKPELLDTLHNQGDIFADGATLKIVDLSTGSTGYADVTQFEAANGYAVDASQSLPTILKDNRMVHVLFSAEEGGSMSGTGINVNYFDLGGATRDKISTLYRRATQTVEGVTTIIWEAMPSAKVKDGDLLLYAGDKWRLMENTNRKVAAAYNPATRYSADDVAMVEGVVYICLQTSLGNDPAAPESAFWVVYTDYNRIKITSETINGNWKASITKKLYNIYKVTTDIVLSLPDELAMFPEGVADNMLMAGDYIICIDEVNDHWIVYNGDAFKYEIDVKNANSTFPILLNVGDVYDVKVSDLGTTANFKGDTRSITFTDGEKIIYAGEDELGMPVWNKIDLTASFPIFNQDARALVGDVIALSDVDGNLGNDTTKLDVPMLNGNMLFNYYDRLYFTGTHWIKATPINAYNEPNRPLLRDKLNLRGFNSDIMVEQTAANKFAIYLLDQFHNAIIGNLDYYSGRLVLKTAIDKTKNKTTVLKGQSSLSDIFKAENYSKSAKQMDTINMTPIRQSSSRNVDGDFDTNFNQYIIANVREPELI